MTNNTLLQQINAKPSWQRKEFLAAQLCRLLADFLGYGEDEVIDITNSFIELGGDSMQAVDFKTLLEQQLECQLQSTLLFDYPRVDILLEFLAHQVLDLPITEQEAEQKAEQETATQESHNAFEVPSEWHDLSPEQLKALLIEKSQSLQQFEQSANDPIAIIGMACRMPGGANDPQAFWQLLKNNQSGISEVPALRWDKDDFASDEKAPGKIASKLGGFIDDVDMFDTQFFAISPKESIKMDPQQRVLMEVAAEVIDNAGYSLDSFKGSNTGVFVGACMSEYHSRGYELELNDIDLYYGMGQTLAAHSGRISYGFGLVGPSFTLDTACSSSLVALHQGCESLRQKESDAAIVAGVKINLSPFVSISASQADMLSPDGCCKTFSANADGYVRAEACVAVLIKRYSDAKRANDQVLALVRGTGVNQDGASGGLTVPNGPAQTNLINQTLTKAGIEPHQLSYIEAHGTGTALGDPIEMGALTQVYGQAHSNKAQGEPPLYIGSVKSNIGHTEPAAGLTGLLKVVLAMEHNTLPANLHFDPPNPHIPWDDIPLKVVKQNTPWLRTKERIASVSSFGFTGTNSHAIISDAPLRVKQTAEQQRSHFVLPLSAKTAQGVQDLAAKYQHFLADESNQDVDLNDMVFTATTGRDHHQYRSSIVCEDKAQLRQKLAILAEQDTSADVFTNVASLQAPKVAFIFTGQGSQYIDMGKQLYASQPVFKQHLDNCNELLKTHWSHDLFSVLFDANKSEEQLNQTQYAQPAIFAIGYALAKLWQHWGIEPSAMMGHSLGEYIAACLAGVFSLEDGIKLLAVRGRLVQSLPTGDEANAGTMVAVMANQQKVSLALKGFEQQVSIGALNTANQTVISGEKAACKTIIERLATAGVKATELAVSHAFHSPLMQPIVGEFEQVLRNITLNEPKVTLISNVTGQQVSNELAQIEYWLEHLLAPVDFISSVNRLNDMGYDTLIEVGPTPHLSAMVKRNLSANDKKVQCLPSLRKDVNDSAQMMRSVAQLYTEGVSINWQQFAQGFGGDKITIPSYPFQRQSYWIDEKRSLGAGKSVAGNKPFHPLLGYQLEVASFEPGRYLFEAVVNTNKQTFLRDHAIYDQVVFPGAGYLEMATAAATQVFATPQVNISEVALHTALLFPESQATTFQLSLKAKDDDSYQFEIHHQPHSLQNDQASTEGRTEDDSEGDGEGDREGNSEAQSWQLLCSGVMSKAAEPAKAELELSQLQEQLQHATPLAADTFYQSYEEIDFYYGPMFQGLTQLSLSNHNDRSDSSDSSEQGNHVLAHIELPQKLQADLEHYCAHPVLIDSGLQLFAALMSQKVSQEASQEKAADNKVYMPVGFESLTVNGQLETNLWAHLTLRTGLSEQQLSVVGDLTFYNSKGACVATLSGVRLVATNRARLVQNDNKAKKLIYRPQWQTQQLGDSAMTMVERSVQDPGSWLILADTTGVADAVAELLEQYGERCVLLTQDEVDFSNPEEFIEIIEDEFAPGIAPLSTVLHFWALDNSDQHNQQRQQAICQSTMSLMQAMGEVNWSQTDAGIAPKCWFITRGAQGLLEFNKEVSQESKSQLAQIDPSQATLWGLAGSIDAESPQYRPVCVDIDPNQSDLTAVAQQLFTDLWTPDNEKQLAYRGEQRLALTLAQGQQLKKLALPTTGPFSLNISQYGMLENLDVYPATRTVPSAGQVEIAISASALNFKDVLHTLGMLQQYSEQLGIMTAMEQPLGFECAGKIIAVGKGVNHLAVGDEVITTAPKGCIKSHVTVDSHFVCKKPEQVNFAEAAALPTVFLTAIYGLEQLAQIKAGDKVLIHAGAGGVGQAALQIAQRAGAEVYATASEGKWDHLKAQGVKQVMNSRSLDFAEQIMEYTNGQGVDIVLNSLAGDYIEKSLSVLAQGGRFIEIGKIDIWTREQVNQYRDDISYFSFDLADESAADANLYPSLLAKMNQGFSDKTLAALPVKTFDLVDGVEAFRYLGQAKNIGKVVLNVPSMDEIVARQSQSSWLQADHNYLITGGLGALGLHVAKFLVENGANCISLTGRSAPSAHAEKVISELKKQGAMVQVFATDVSDGDQTLALFEQLNQLPPLAGIVHGAGVLDDGILPQQDWQRFSKVLAPKVMGGWHLHQASKDKSLDFFVCFSSIASLLGAPGQSNYAAANAYLDALVQHRQSLGLCGVSINWGAWGGGGMASDLSKADQKRLAQMGIKDLAVDEALQAMRLAIEGEQAQIGVMDIDWQRYFSVQSPGEHSFFSHFANDNHDELDQADAQMLSELQQLPLAEARSQLFNFMQAQIAKVLGFASANMVDGRQQLFDLGIDSLLAIDFKNRIEKSLDCELHSTLLFDYPTLDSLTEYLLEQLMPQTADNAATKVETTETVDTVATDETAIDDMSEQQLAQALAAALDEELED